MDAHEDPNGPAWCPFCGAGPFSYDVGSGGWDEHWRACEKSPRSFEERAAALGVRKTFPADRMNQIVEVTKLRLEVPGLPAGFPLGHMLAVLGAIQRGEDAPADSAQALDSWRDQYLAEKKRVAAPLQAVLHCPKCGTNHVDRDEWAARPHHTHLCGSCGFLWRVEPYCVGVEPPEDDGLEDGMVASIALALAELSLRRPGWTDHLRDIANHYDAHLLFEQFRASSAGAVPEAPDSPLVSRVEELTREVHRLKRKCANYATFANHLEGCKAFVIDRGNCDCGLTEVMCDVNVGLELPPPPDAPREG